MKTFKIVTLSLFVALSTGCASFIANNTSSAVGTESGERSLGQVVIDKSIERTAKINLYKLDARFKQSRINIESFHSSVLLTGQVPDQHLKQLAEDNVKSMTDVKAVHNFITVGNQVSYSTIMQDLGVTANTKALLLRAPLIRESKVLIHTEDAVLYVMGRLNNAEIADLNNVLQNVGNVTKIVTLIDNVEQNQSSASAYAAPAASSNVAGVGLGAVTTTPLADPTPVAIDPNQEQPVNDQVPAQDNIQSAPVSAEP
ncbi:BON domain-containing protein [Acinetobacter populi]|uniref:BON domain-containing protein n=1 Tax=Acinetobacter populi TaxID=1582270 RepID=A0A1Z9YXH1_9GAMM|nr:BON domain-containing protein [Acinetobacter populi]OUY06899.1 BON domain-containing protein [Acinetobacter populi]